MDTKSPDDSMDFGYRKFKDLIRELPKFSHTLHNEADVRMKIVNDILTEALFWEKQDIVPECHTGPGFADYILSIGAVSKMVVEVKKLSRTFGLSTRPCGVAYKLSGPAFKNKDADEGIQQVIKYSAFKNTELACVTNGYEWIVFRSNRIGDGTDTLDGKAFAFPSLECIDHSFALFFDLIAKQHVRDLKFRAIFREAEGKVIRPSAFRRTLRPAENATFLPQPAVVPLLDRLMTTFFQRLSDENDREMVEYCFVETNESRAAERHLLRVAEELVGHIQTLDTESGAQLLDLIDQARISRIKQFVLLVGTKGAGKSAFINRFFDLKLAEELKSAIIPIIVNLAESDGTSSTIIDWLRSSLLEKAESALGAATPTWDELVGHMFFREYTRWAQGTMKHMYESDKEQFKIEFGKHIESIRKDKPLDYLRGLLKGFVNGRRQLPCIVIDNADHFSIELQDSVFQFARALFDQEICVVIMPITDKTSWHLSQQGALQSFDNESLILPTPSPKVVLEKRITYVLGKMEELEEHDGANYLVGKGIRVSVKDVVKFARGLQGIFLNAPTVGATVGHLANRNIREVLHLSRDVINSPHIGIDEIFKTYVLGEAIHVPPYKTTRAIIRGRYDIYVDATNKFVRNIYALNGELETTPLLGLRMLQLLRDAVVLGGDTKSRYMAKSDLYEYLVAMGIDRRAVGLWLDALLKSAMIFNYDPTCTEEDSATSLEIAPAGELHLRWGGGNYEYVAAMAEVTPIHDEPSYERILDASKRKGGERFRQMRAAFTQYLLVEDQMFCRIPDHTSYQGQHELSARLRAN